MISFLKPNLPPLDEYITYLRSIWRAAQLTNNGPLIIELENRLKEYLDIPFLTIVSSGTTALQIAINALELEGEIITTAFSHLSTTNAILWQHCTPKITDIEEDTFCIDATKIEGAISKKTCAILATHVYGYPCNVELIESIAKKHKLKVVYDGAQAFAVKFRNESIFKRGDVSIVSFNATKIFHTIEGGAIIANSEEMDQKCGKIRNFGLEQEAPDILGINGKNSEVHAAMGLCNLAKAGEYIKKNREISLIYKSILRNTPLQFPKYKDEVDYNFSYFPIIFDSKDKANEVRNELLKNGIYTKKYFSPSLNKLPYNTANDCPVAEKISELVLCLPIYNNLSCEDADKVGKLIAAQF